MAELRETIEMLKTQNTDAQTAIQVALNGPDHLHKGNERDHACSLSPKETQPLLLLVYL